MRRLSWCMFPLLACAAGVSAQAPRLTPLGTFGCGDCDGPLMFSTVHALAITVDSAIIVADGDAPGIRIFDARGRLQRAFGTRGEGPGELRLPIGVGMLEGSVAVVDMTNQRITRFSMDGRTQATQRLNGFPAAASFPPGGGAPVLMYTSFTRPEVMLGRLRGDSVAELRRIGPVDFPERSSGGFELLGVAAARDGSVAVGDGIGAYRIVRYASDGTVRHIIRRDIVRAKYSAEELEELARERERTLASRRARAQAESRSAAASFRPPAIRQDRNFFNMNALVFDERGRLWVRVERGPLAQTTFDVFDAGGDFIGEVRIRARVGRFGLGNGLLAGVVLDEMAVPRIAVWRVE
jgi:hypothetical protein